MSRHLLYCFEFLLLPVFRFFAQNYSGQLWERIEIRFKGFDGKTESHKKFSKQKLDDNIIRRAMEKDDEE